jgi:hypothetical protein
MADNCVSFITCNSPRLGVKRTSELVHVGARVLTICNMGGAATTGAVIVGTNNDTGAMATGGFGAGNGNVDGASAVGKPAGTDCCIGAFTGAGATVGGANPEETGATAVWVDPVDENDPWNADIGCWNTGVTVLDTGKLGNLVEENDTWGPSTGGFGDRDVIPVLGHTLALTAALARPLDWVGKPPLGPLDCVGKPPLGASVDTLDAGGAGKPGTPVDENDT